MTNHTHSVVQTPAGRKHIARPSRIPGRWVLACSGRTMAAFLANDRTTAADCAHCADLTVEDLAR